ncbi:MAG TPA: DUF2845 domain-containing protein [Steroidobacteraceae bacterium]
MRLAPILCVIAACLVAPAASADDAMRCGSRLVTFGDTRGAVLARCGEPAEIQFRSILRRPSYRLNGRVFYYGDGFVEVPVEIWTYNFGPYKFMRRVRFVDGIVDEIETLGYGYRERPAAAAPKP